jgi:hypothetical protein
LRKSIDSHSFPIVEKFPKINDKTFFYAFIGFCIQNKRLNLNEKNNYADKNPKWRSKIKMASNCHFYLPHMEYKGSIGLVSRKIEKNYC